MNILFPYSQSIYKLNLSNLFSKFIKKQHNIKFIKKIDELSDPTMKNIDLILSNQAWWNIENEIGKLASQNKIPHITIEHGTPMFYQSNKQYYRRSIGHADIKLLWGQHNLNMMKKYNCPLDKLIITGYPRFDDLLKYKSVKNNTPKILFLSTWKIPGKIKIVWERVVEQTKSLNYELLLKPHPMEKGQMSFIGKNNIPDFVKIINNENLFKYISESDLIITSPTSTLIPILYFRKPLFSYYPTFTKKYFKGMMNFYRNFKIPHYKQIQKIDLEKMLNFKVERERNNKYLKHLSFKNDGKNTERVYQFCLEFVELYKLKNGK